MHMVFLLPRLPGLAAEVLLDDLLGNGLDARYAFDPKDLPEAARFGATGGRKVDPAELNQLREELLRLAESNGFPGARDRTALARFDAETGAMLVEQPILASGEALRDDVWAFIGVSLAPDIVNWRFGKSRERYLGGIRNTFQRLWMRARSLDRGANYPDRWRLLEELTEDALVQISERPSLGGEPMLATAIAETWVRAARHHGKTAMEPIMRRAALRLRIWNETRSLVDLPSNQLEVVLATAFDMPTEREKNVAAANKLLRDEMNAVGSPPGTDDNGAKRQQSEYPIGARVILSSAKSHAATLILNEAKKRRWLSPKSINALNVLRDGTRDLTSSERNAFNYLLGKLRSAAILPEEISQLSQDQDVASTVSSSTDRSSAKPRSSTRKRRRAILRAK